jgi:hypothetical protein
MYFKNLLNTALILENKHRFKEDPVYGQMMSDMWFDDLSVEQKKEINKRDIMDKRTIPDVLDDDSHYACPTNRHRNIISANNFRRQSWPPTGEFTFTGTQQTLSNTPHTTDYAFYCMSQNTNHSASEDPPSTQSHINHRGKYTCQ